MNSKFTFASHSLDLENGRAFFSYRLQTKDKIYSFMESILFPTEGIQKDIAHDVLQTLLDNLLLILGISYWKLTCPQILETPTISLTKKQATFWNTVYTKGLGEFFYKNTIDFKGLINFPYKEHVILDAREKSHPSNQDNS